MKKYNIAIIGATGLVGSMFIKLLEEYNIPINELKLYASSKSKGKIIKFKNKNYIVEELSNNSFDNIDYALFATNKNISGKYCLIAESKGVICIDNSSFFRMKDDIALVIPEINYDDINLTKRKIIANPNCSTIQCLLVLNIINKIYKIKKIIYNTYQSVSGSGMKGIFDLQSTLEGYHHDFYPLDISSTCIPLIGDIKENNYTEEEIKMINETKKILHLNNVDISSTCVRVPIFYGHGVSIYLEFDQEIEIDVIIEELKKYDYIYLNNIANTIDVYNTDKVSVGRIRKGINNKSMWLYCTADNLRIGASSNALKILKKMIS